MPRIRPSVSLCVLVGLFFSINPANALTVHNNLPPFAGSGHSPPRLNHLNPRRSLGSTRRFVARESSETTGTRTSATALIADPSSSSSFALAPLSQVDVLYGRKTPLQYDATLDRYIPLASHKNATSSRRQSFIQQRLLPSLSVAFLPQSVTPNYYNFIRWRVTQRFVNANLHVFGTQSLLLGLGLSNANANNKLALSAALNWVLKDALGKIVRMLWASRMGRRFDSDAKRWRFRSACSYALGNALEIVTYLNPQLFLVWATLANAFKQMSMLTSSSTRTAIYNSFRNGTDNIGDITAKGEAQIAIVDLLGIASGVCLSRAIGTSPQSIIAAYVILQAMEISCMYQQLRCVQYRVFNFERLVTAITSFCTKLEQGGARWSKDDPSSIPTPKEIADKERLFFRSDMALQRQVAFGSLERSKLSPRELDQLLDLFRGERFLLVVGRNVKQQQRPRFIGKALQPWINECHIVLHEEATNVDIVKSTFALILLRRLLAASDLDPETSRSADCMAFIRTALAQADQFFPILLRQMTMSSWESPARSMFGRVHMRAEWPLQPANKTRIRTSDAPVVKE